MLTLSDCQKCNQVTTVADFAKDAGGNLLKYLESKIRLTAVSFWCALIQDDYKFKILFSFVKNVFL